MIGSDFITKTYKYSVHCSECGRKLLPGEPVLVSIRNGKVKKRVCSEDCRLRFDAKFWEAVARRNAGKRICGCGGTGICGRMIEKDGSVWPARDTGYRIKDKQK